MKNNYLQLTVGILLIALSILILNPLHFWMPDMAHIAVLASLLVLFGIFAAFILKEQVQDEREAWLRMRSGRMGYLAGASVLVLGIAIQGIHGAVDPWLILGLLAMLLAKLAAHFYIDSK